MHFYTSSPPSVPVFAQHPRVHFHIARVHSIAFLSPVFILVSFRRLLFEESSSRTTYKEPLFSLPTRTPVTIRTPPESQIPTENIKERAALVKPLLDPKQIILRHPSSFASESTVEIPPDTNHQKGQALIDTLPAFAQEQKPVDIYLSKANLTGSSSSSETSGSKPTLWKDTLQSCLLPAMSEMIPRSASRTDVATSNPWQNLVKEFDPDNTMEDGRSYVGKASHLLDRPVASRGGRGGFGGGHASGPTRDMPKLSPSGSYQPPRPPPQSQRQAWPAPRGPPSYRPQSKHRWSGQSLATANSLPPGFFATAKPRAPAPESLATERQTQVRPRPPPPTDPQQWSQSPPSRVFKGPTQVETPHPESQIQPQSLPSTRGPHQAKQIETPAPTSPSSPVQGRQEQPTVVRTPPPPATAAGGVLTANTDRPSVELQRSSATSSWGTGSTTANAPRHRSESLIDLMEDETMSIYSTGSEHDSVRRPTSGKQALSGGIRDRSSNNREVPAGDPVVFQYPLADGQWATLALYVDRDARSAQSRFSDIRTRQMSDIKKKSPEDVGKIVAKVIQETVEEDG